MRSIAGSSIILLCPIATLAAPAVVFTEPTFTVARNNQTIGWQFDVMNPITVTGLSWYDFGGDGLTDSHAVGLWTRDGKLLASANVPAGKAAGLDGEFRTVAITPLVLPVAIEYTVGGVTLSTTGDAVVGYAESQSLAPGLRFFSSMFSGFGTELQRPLSYSSPRSGFYGPGFSVIPEPSTLTFTGISGVILRRRRERPAVSVKAYNRALTSADRRRPEQGLRQTLPPASPRRRRPIRGPIRSS